MPMNEVLREPFIYQRALNPELLRGAGTVVGARVVVLAIVDLVVNINDIVCRVLVNPEGKIIAPFLVV